MGRAGLEDLSLLLQPASDPYSGKGADNSMPPAGGFSGLSQYLGSKTLPSLTASLSLQSNF